MKWIGMGLAAVAVVCIVGALIWLFGGASRPAPTGPFAVGTRLFTVEDPQRLETWGAHIGEPRQVAVRVWYPATPGDEPLLTSMDGRVSAAFGELYGFPIPGSDGPPSASRIDAAPLGEAHPVVLFSHGGFSDAGQNASLMEELASHGYVAVSIGHTHESVMTLFPADRAVPIEPELGGAIAELQDASAETIGTYRRALDALTSASSHAEARAAALGLGEAYREMWSPMPVSIDDLVETRVGDLERVAEVLRGWNADPENPLYGQLDLDRLAIAGHSLGAYAVVHAAAQQRVSAQAIVALDIPYFLLDGSHRYRVDQPLLSLYAESTRLGHGERAHTAGANRFLAASQRERTLAGTSHMNLSDMNFLPRVVRFTGLLGPVDGAEATEVVRAEVLSFLEDELD